MCRFKLHHLKKPIFWQLFQYILCVGSRKISFEVNANMKSFNTSYVSVQEDDIKAIKNLIAFQYILCVGSRQLIDMCKVFSTGFNTSYVSVQGSNLQQSRAIQQSFNTSYVSVQAFTMVMEC